MTIKENILGGILLYALLRFYIIDNCLFGIVRLVY